MSLLASEERCFGGGFGLGAAGTGASSPAVATLDASSPRAASSCLMRSISASVVMSFSSRTSASAGSTVGALPPPPSASDDSCAAQRDGNARRVSDATARAARTVVLAQARPRPTCVICLSRIANDRKCLDFFLNPSSTRLLPLTLFPRRAGVARLCDGGTSRARGRVLLSPLTLSLTPLSFCRGPRTAHEIPFPRVRKNDANEPAA